MAEQKTISKERKDAFLKELTELTLRHGIQIMGCGCCESPWLADVGEVVEPVVYTVSADYQGYGMLGLTTQAEADRWEFLNTEREKEREEEVFSDN